MIKLARILVPFGAALLAVPSFAQAQLTFGPEVGTFIPTSSRLRDAMGDSWLSFGLGSVRLDRTFDSRPRWDTEFITQTRNGSKVFMGTVSSGIVIPLDGSTGYGLRRQSQTTPYAAARIGLSYTDYAINRPGTTGLRDSSKRIGPNGNLEIGLMVGDNLTFAARYDFNPSYSGYNFSGLSLSARYGIIRF
ncbi:MAG: hypothetical protein MH204_09655 [Fimbriimonadaceae bacterium]|nr:hypothetical protein [Fimbriimonadaceae bacterium]